MSRELVRKPFQRISRVVEARHDSQVVSRCQPIYRDLVNEMFLDNMIKIVRRKFRDDLLCIFVWGL